MKISIGSDHAGVQYKQAIITFLEQHTHQVINRGTNSETSCDYPDYAHPVAEDVEQGRADFGILICGTANGVAMTANKHQGIRAAIAWNEEVASLAKSHNDANILCIPARFVSLDKALAMLIQFMNTSFEGGRHANRIKKIPC